MDLRSESEFCTLKEMLAQTVARRGDSVAVRFKQKGAWLEITYNDLQKRVAQVAELLTRRGIKPGDKVAIFRENCHEWPETYFGIVSMGATAVPVDAKLLEPEVAHILRDSEARLLFTATKHYPIVREIADGLPHLESIYVKDLQEIQPVISRRIKYFDYDAGKEDVREAAEGANSTYERLDPKADAIASFIYTSGTTGRQKGAMLTHANFVANVNGCRRAVQINEDDNFLLVLPLHHAFAFMTNLLIPIAVGSEISFVENLRTVGENIREVNPTVICGVPLLLEKMYGRIWAGLRANKPAYLMFCLGIRKPVIKGIQKKLGGKLRICVTGGAACDPDILRGFQRLGVGIIEGYGLTETAPVLTINPEARPKPGTVGRALPGVEVAILDPDAEGVGEIAAKGPNIMRGYYHHDEATAAAFRDGWFLTGDLGFLDEDGYLTITGRKKDLIVNREGKNIYPAEVEIAICKSPIIAEALVLSYQMPQDTVGERLGVIVVPDQEALDGIAAGHSNHLSDTEVSELVRQEVRKASSQLSEYKRPRRVQVRLEEFEKTSTGKIKRYLYAMDAVSVDS